MDGTVLVGVEDDGSIYEPFQSVDKDYLDTKIANWLQDTIYPLPSYLVKHHFNEDGVLVIDIKEGKDKPYYLREKGPKPADVYKRVGRSIRKASEDEILRMIMSSKNYNYENDISDEQNLTFQSLTNAFKDNDIELNDRNLISLGIMNSNSKFTNLGFILSVQLDITVKIAEYDKQRNFKLKKQFTGSLIDLFYYVKEQADRLNDVSAKIDIKTFKRNEIVSYPGASLREIILNAFIHADYFIRSNIKIEFFEDKCKITSPGGIFNASMEEIMRGIQTYRNHKLVNIFDKLGLIENFGTGIPRTLDAYANEQRKPLFEATENFFYVTLPNLNYKVDDQINDQINELDLVILQTIFNHPGIKVSEIKKELEKTNVSITLDQIRNSIKRKISSYIEYRGSRKTGDMTLKMR